MALKVPAGASVCPNWLLPQQLTLPLVLIAQLWRVPAAMALKVPEGASACP